MSEFYPVLLSVTLVKQNPIHWVYRTYIPKGSLDRCYQKDLPEAVKEWWDRQARKENYLDGPHILEYKVLTINGLEGTIFGISLTRADDNIYQEEVGVAYTLAPDVLTVRDVVFNGQLTGQEVNDDTYTPRVEDAIAILLRLRETPALLTTLRQCWDSRAGTPSPSELYALESLGLGLTQTIAVRNKEPQTVTLPLGNLVCRIDEIIPTKQ